MLMPTSDVAVAATRLRDAHAALDDSAALLRRAAVLAWDSSAGEDCRAAISDLLTILATDSGAVEQAVRVTAALETS
ncbi:hypothetical protein [Isoptericola sp. G70]|uniref:hypothetical protein n=1 Tax=Isoptericola sp. G70 TaxID=3376633 RepID=UPI003A8003A3